MDSKQSKPILVYQMKVTLLNIEPPIWRRFQVTSDRTIYRLHLILQTIMGWQNYHLYQFTVDNVSYGEPDEEYEPDVKQARRYKLNQIIRAEKQRLYYIYDYGDNWEHEILVEKILTPKPGIQYPVCLAGERACPPEDCGGVTGYTELLEIIKDPEHPEYENMMTWLGRSFDPEAFDLKGVNTRLKYHSKESKVLPMFYPTMRANFQYRSDMFPLINRNIAIIKPRAPFLEWLESLPDWDLDITLEDLRSDCTVFLIPELDDEDAIKYIEDMHKEIFEYELDSWHRDESLWPEKRTLKLFREWFDIELHSMVLDTLDEEIEKDI